MNKIFLMGRLTYEPDLKYSSKDTSVAITRYTLAVNRRFAKKDDPQTADFIRCVVFGKQAEFASKYFHKGMRIAVEGRLQIGEYTNKDGQKVSTADVIVENQEFADAAKGATSDAGSQADKVDDTASLMEGFIDIPGGTDDDELPFD